MVPRSGVSKPASSRSSVVLPLPDGPRMAVREPAGTSRSRSARTEWVPKRLCSSADLQAVHCGDGRPGGEPVEETTEHIAGQGGDRDDRERKWGGLAVGEVLLVGPELGRERLHAGRDQDQRGGQLGHRREEHEAERGGQPGPISGSVTRHSTAGRRCPSERATSSRPGGACMTDARTPTRASGKNRIA